MGAGAHKLGDLAQQIFQVERTRMHLDPVFAQTGEIQQFVDQAQQMFAAVAQGGDIGPLLRRQPRSVQ